MNTELKLQEIIHNIEQLQVGDYSTPLAFSKIILDTAIAQNIETLYQALNGDKFTDIVLVGIGGSHLGVQAVYDALYPLKNKSVRLHALTTVDTFTLDTFIDSYTKMLQDSSKQVMTFVVSKSGATFETASQASLCFDILKKHAKDYGTRLCVITDADSKLWHACQQEQIPVLTIPKNIGGRFSIFSAAGLALLRFLQVDIQDFLRGAQSVDAVQPLVTTEALYNAFSAGILVHDTFIFMQNYAALGGWTRQLIGESLGKDNKGFLATVSIGSQDLHSVIQQYFGGKQITITSFIIPAEYPVTPQIPDTFFSETAMLRTGLSFSDIQKAIITGVQSSYTQLEKPYFTFVMRKDSAFDIGFYMQYKMLETVYLGALMEINPFDQPQVELYKTETRTLLR